jgi:hypothetical protein
MGNKHMNKGSISLAIKEMQIKMTLRFYLTPIRVTIINNTNKTNADEDVGEKGIFLHCW